MITLAALTEEIAGHLQKELDEPFKRMLADKIDHWRSRLLRNSLEKNPNQSKFFRQDLFVQLEPSAVIPDCVGIKAPVCPVLRSKEPIPTPARITDSLFDYAGSVDGQHPFLEVSTGTESFIGALKYIGKEIQWRFFNGEWVEVLNATSLPAMRFSGVFDAPFAVMEFNCKSINCDPWNERYPVTGELAQIIVQSILTVDFNRPVAQSSKEVDINTQRPSDEGQGQNGR